MLQKMEYYTERTLEYATDYGVKILGALAIFFIGRWIIRKIIVLMRKAMVKSRVDETLISFSANLTTNTDRWSD